MANPDAPAPKRPRLDSVNPVYNGHPFPPPSLPPHAQPARPPSHPTPTQASTPTPPRHFLSHSLPPPSQSYPSSGPSTLASTDIRNLVDPRALQSPSQRPNGTSNASPVTTGILQDSISTYRTPQTPQPSNAPEPVDVKPSSSMDHGSHTGSWSMNQEHRPDGNISNGYSQSTSPPQPNDQAYHPPPPPPGHQYGQPALYAPSPYMGQYSGSGQAQVRRKQVRATQACNHCRSRKQKCDEARPCQFCRENNFDCQYKDVPPPKQDRSMMQLQESVNNMSDILSSFIGEFSAWRQNVETRLPPNRPFDGTAHVASPNASFVPPRDPSTSSRVPTPAQGRNAHRSVGSLKMESPMHSLSTMSPVNAQASTPIKQESTMIVSQQPATPAESTRTDNSHSSATREKPGLHSDHSTPAHMLLEEWGLMSSFSENVESLKRLKDDGHPYSQYPMHLEQERGLLRVWGVGEGYDPNDGAQGPGSPESSNDSDAPSPAPGKEGVWGHPPLDHASPQTVSSNTPRKHLTDEPAGGLGPDDRPNFSSAVMDRYHKSYMEHMHPFHPFLNPSKLQRMMREFKNQYSPDSKAASASSPAFSHLNSGMKRKRSSSAFGEPYSPQGAIERSLRNAIVLLVLALGQVCCYRDPLPSPQPDKGSPANGIWGSVGSNPNASFGSDVSEDNRPRNIDILPGMAYYSYATDILGNQGGGLTVGHAQAMLLAALYLGQYARVMESWSWIHNACKIAIVLIKKDYKKLERAYRVTGARKMLPPRETYRLDLVLLVYWTCVQLESDILAEMSTLPTSNVTQHQSIIDYPEGVYERLPADGNEPMVPASALKKPGDDSELMIYSSQIWMRIIINEAHNALYGAEGVRSIDLSDISAVHQQAQQHLAILRSWRNVLPIALKWRDDEFPATDLNMARLRAKYYGGAYMMLRPYLRIAAHEIEFPPSHQRSQRYPQWSNHNSPMAEAATFSPRSAQMVDLTDSQTTIVDLATQCVKCAIQSTVAFDRVGAPVDSPYEGYKSTRTTRLVLTNIFGTLHAQFGNMLVLAAVYKSRLYAHLPPDLLTPQTLHALFARTLTILDETAPNSAALRVDAEILRNVRSQLIRDGLLYRTEGC